MTCTSSTNIDIEGIARILLKEDDFAICGHTSPDGDCIGSTLAMKAILDALGKRNWALVADADFNSSSLDFMPGIESLQFAGDFQEKPNIFIAVDVPNSKRLGKYASEKMNLTPQSLTIDHHESDKNSSTYRYIDPESASCTLIIWKIATTLVEICSDEVFDQNVMRDIALCCYSGLLTDTGRFMFQNTNDECFALAKEMVETGIKVSDISSRLFQEKSLASIKLNALVANRMEIFNGGKVVLSWLEKADIDSVGGSNSDTEDCINVIRSLEGAQVACMLKERNNAVRGSLRAKGDINVAEIASEFGGGGHIAAAGFTLECSLDEAKSMVLKRLGEIDFDTISKS